jgi:hypothetical protein
MNRAILSLLGMLFGAAAGAQTVIPAGTTFRIRTVEVIDVDSTQAGRNFHGTLDDPIMVGGSPVVPRYANVVLVATKVEQGGKFKGSDLVQLKVNSIAVHGHTYPVVTSLAETKSGGEGAIIGGIAGGGTGAAIGALAGAAGGTILSASGEPHLKVPAETRLTFQLLADWKIQ